jgi:diguanylate cyclase (GGDEF)-like protein
MNQSFVGCFIAGSVEEHLERAIARSKRDKNPLTLIVFDLDDFKSINDKFGHARGDEVLKTIAEAIHKAIRPEDLLARLGGDEFVIVLSTMNYEQSEAITNRLMDAVRIALSDIKSDTTLSTGVITNTSIRDSAAMMLKRADQLMYEVKREGKNGRKHIIDGGPPQSINPDRV